MMKRKLLRISSAILVCFLVLQFWNINPAQAEAASTIVNDTAAKTVTLTNNRFTMIYDYNCKSVITSFRYGSLEMLGAQGIDSAMRLDADSSIISSTSLPLSPVVTVNQNTVMASYSMSNSRLTVDEVWLFTLTNDNIQLKVDRIYHWIDTTDTKLSHNAMLEMSWQRIWDNIRRPDDGGNIPLGNAYTGKNGMYLNVSGERVGIEQGNFEFLNADTSQALLLTTQSNRSIASEFAFVNDGQTHMEGLLNAGTWEYTAGTKANGLVIGGHSATNGAYIYSPVSTAQSQEDTITYTFAPGDYAACYSLGGTINGISDKKAFSSLLNDFGRSDIIDKDYGFSTVGIYQTGHGAYDSPYFLPLMEGLFDKNAVTSEENQLVYDKDYAQGANGHLSGRTYHRDTVWTADTLFDSDPAYALSVSRVYEYSPDTTWLNSMRTSVENALGYMIQNRLTSSGLFANDLTSTSQKAITREWNDNIYVTYQSAYLNIMMYDALSRWADLESSLWSDTSLASLYRQTADKIASQFNKTTSDGGFWDPVTSSFVYWRDQDGSIHGNVVQSQVNLMAIEVGLTDLQRSKQILQAISQAMTANHLLLIPENFVSYPSSEVPSGEGFQDGVENGAIYPLFVEDYMAAAAKVGERDMSLTYLNNVLQRYQKDGFNGFSHLNWSLSNPGGFQERWFPVNANAAAGLYKWMLGVQPTRNGITIAPNIPSSMNSSNVTETVRGTETISITYFSETSLNINWSSSTLPVTVSWSGQTPQTVYTITDNGTPHQVAADSFGKVDYTYTGSGSHAITLASGDSSEVQPTSVSASYTYYQDDVAQLCDGIISYNDSPRNRWTAYNSPNASDWAEYDFGSDCTFSSAKLYVYNDNGGVQSPASYDIQYWNGSGWVSVSDLSITPSQPETGLNTATFSAVTSSKFRIVLNHKGNGVYSGLTELSWNN